MISRKNRFHGHNSVSRVRGPSAHSEILSIRYSSNKKKDYRLAVVVSKKVDNRAVVRNRIRRRIYESVRTQGRLNNLAIDVVFYVKDISIATVPNDKLNEEVAILTKKALKALH